MDSKFVSAIAEALTGWEQAENIIVHNFSVTDAGLTIEYTNLADKRPIRQFDHGSRFRYLAADIGAIRRDHLFSRIHIHHSNNTISIWTQDFTGKQDYSQSALLLPGCP